MQFGDGKKTNRDRTILERRDVKVGEMVMREGEAGNLAYLIQGGKLRVFREKDGQKIELATMTSGQIVGEMALVTDEKRSASVEAVEDSSLIVISRKTLAEKLEKSDPTVRALVPMLMRRLGKSNEVVMNRQTDVDELVEAVSTMCDGLVANLGVAQKRSFEKSVLPKKDEFIEAVLYFKKRYSEE